MLCYRPTGSSPNIKKEKTSVRRFNEFFVDGLYDDVSWFRRRIDVYISFIDIFHSNN